MPTVIDEARLRACLAEHWGLTDPVVRAHHGGMNSATWLIWHGDRRWVAKAVPPEQKSAVAAGLAVAARLERAGVPAGAAVPTAGGHLVADVDGMAVGLLTWVGGDPLTGAGDGEQDLIGRTLGRVHHLLTGVAADLTGTQVQRFHWVDTDADHLGIRPWLRPAVTAAVAAYEESGPPSLTWGLLHADPAPEAFRLDAATGVCGVIDWQAALVGPLMYDVASAVMYVGGPSRAGALLSAYQRQQVLSRAEIDRALPVMLRMRWAVQADYFARRIAAGDLTGIAGPADNETGLADARQRLTGDGGR
jgi:Ser/Thr protein kinase RdoA (MazF antagonist)